jgi:tRNA pseudouridine38-40 synthase
VRGGFLNRVLKLTVEYHGAGFAGWAAQPGLRTVEGVLGDALEEVLGQTVELSVAGRTDAGVHARAQVASFVVPGGVPADRLAPGRPLRSLNGVLPDDLAVHAVEQAADGFDARRDARSRRYVYRVLARQAPSPFERDRSLWWPNALDQAALEACAKALAGPRDFTAFTPTRTDHVRFERNVLAASWRREGEMLEFWIEADSFMRHMVRVLVGTMLEAGSGRRDPAGFAALLEGAPRNAAGETAPAHGLHLAAVTY